LVSDNGETDASLFFFFRAVSTDNADVGGMSVLGHGGNWDEKQHVSARNNLTVNVHPTVTQASDFVGAQIYPFVAISACSELAIFGSVSGVRVDGGTVEGTVVGIQVERGSGSRISSWQFHFFIIPCIVVGIGVD
jgi:hypothetical protein